MSNCSSVEKGILERAIQKIPGNLAAPNPKEKQGYVDLSTKTKNDILELIERQNKLIEKTGFVNSLPDKGEKIVKYKNYLEEELKKREKSDELSEMLLKLNIHGKKSLDKLEWTKNCNPGQCESVDETKEDDETNDPLQIFATHSGTVFNQRINRVLPPEASLIKPSDVEGESQELNGDQITDISNNIKEQDAIDELYVKNLCDKFDNAGNVNKQDKFLPHRTLIHHKDTTNVQKPKKPYWEVTAATPPPSVYNNVKLIPLETSVKLQIHQAEKLKEIQMKHATEKLKALSGKGIGNGSWNLCSKGAQFRESQTHYDSGSSSSDEDEQDKYHSCNEEEDEVDEKVGGVTFYNFIDN